MAEDVGSTRSGLERNPMLQDGQGNLDAPKTVIPSVRVARGLYYKFRSDHLKRIQLYAAIEGLIAGNPPYDPVELARSGLGHIANFNNLDARSFLKGPHLHIGI